MLSLILLKPAKLNFKKGKKNPPNKYHNRESIISKEKEYQGKSFDFTQKMEKLRRRERKVYAQRH